MFTTNRSEKQMTRTCPPPVGDGALDTRSRRVAMEATP